MAASARRPALLTPSSWDRTSSSRPRHPRSFTTTRNACLRTATAGSRRSRGTSRWTRPIDEPRSVLAPQDRLVDARRGSADTDVPKGSYSKSKLARVLPRCGFLHLDFCDPHLDHCRIPQHRERRGAAAVTLTSRYQHHHQSSYKTKSRFI